MMKRILASIIFLMIACNVQSQDVNVRLDHTSIAGADYYKFAIWEGSNPADFPFHADSSWDKYDLTGMRVDSVLAGSTTYIFTSPANGNYIGVMGTSFAEFVDPALVQVSNIKQKPLALQQMQFIDLDFQ